MSGQVFSSNPIYAPYWNQTQVDQYYIEDGSNPEANVVKQATVTVQPGNNFFSADARTSWGESQNGFLRQFSLQFFQQNTVLSTVPCIFFPADTSVGGTKPFMANGMYLVFNNILLADVDDASAVSQDGNPNPTVLWVYNGGQNAAGSSFPAYVRASCLPIPMASTQIILTAIFQMPFTATGVVDYFALSLGAFSL